MPDNAMQTTLHPSTDGARAPRPHPRNLGFCWRDADATAATLLDAATVAQFNRDGYFVLRNAFDAATLAAVTAAIDPLEKAQDEAVRAAGNQLQLSAADAITFTTHLVARSPVLKAFAQHAVFQSLCHDLIGAGARLYWDQSVYKKSGKPQEFPWHQDNGYTFVEPQQYLTCWVPLVDADVDNGCPWIAPGRHAQGTLAHWLTPIGLKCLEDVPDAVPAPARAGDVVVFSSLAPHRTGPNLRAGTVRKTYILQYAPDGAVALRDDQPPEPQTDPARQFRVDGAATP
jgi:ectoine hydroxylase-related dioxygenase (phytanoyl-CoA dioxygenase family)